MRKFLHTLILFFYSFRNCSRYKNPCYDTKFLQPIAPIVLCLYLKNYIFFPLNKHYILFYFIFIFYLSPTNTRPELERRCSCSRKCTCVLVFVLIYLLFLLFHIPFHKYIDILLIYDDDDICWCSVTRQWKYLHIRILGWRDFVFLWLEVKFDAIFEIYY